MSLISRSLRSERVRSMAAHILMDAGLVLGGTLALAAASVLIGRDGGLAYDTRAYWLAARHVLDGTALYTPASVSDLGAFKYPPLFAQLFVPVALLPELLVAWLWRVSGILCLRYMVGSWKAAVVACLFVPVLTELSLGNVTLQIGAVLVFALRDRRGAYLVPWVAALKFGPVLIVPYLWFRLPASRRPLVIGTAVFAAACLLSYAIAPGAWSAYVSTFGWENESLMSGNGVLAIVPSWGGMDFVVRFAIAGAVALYAVYSRKAWLAYGAAVITCPVLAFSRFAPLVAWWRFRRESIAEPAGSEPSGDAPAASADIP
jgi:Glycosyltransferase family 87